MNACACGCGTLVRKTWDKGHHWRALRDPSLPTEKPCAVCGEVLVRGDGGYRETDRMWQRRSMHKTCRSTFNQQNFAGRAVKVEVKPESGRARARKLYPLLGVCEGCEERPARDRHHKDENTANNDRENVAFLCRSCHLLAEYELGRTRRGK